MWFSRGRAFPAKGTASAKALRWVHAWWGPLTATRRVCLQPNKGRNPEELAGCTWPEALGEKGVLEVWSREGT